MPLSLGAVSASANRLLKRLHWAVTNIAADLGVPAAGDTMIVYDASDNYEPKYATISQALGASPATQIFTQGTPAAKTTTTTLTAAELLIGIITASQGAAGAAAYTMPLGTDLEAAMVAAYPALAINSAFDFSVINISTNAAEDVTMTTNTGWTLVGNMVVESNTTNVNPPHAMFRVRRTAASTFTLYRIAG
jgi:hypothetical protein